MYIYLAQKLNILIHIAQQNGLRMTCILKSQSVQIIVK